MTTFGFPLMQWFQRLLQIKLLQQSAILAMGRALDRALLLVLFVLMGRVLGVAEYGQFSYAFALASLIGVASELGLSLWVNREVARVPPSMKGFVDNGSAIRIAVGVLTTALVCGVLVLTGAPQATALMVLFLLSSMMIEAFQGLLFAVFRAQGRMAYQTVVVVVTRAATVAAGLLLLYATHNGVIVSTAFLAGSMVGGVLAVWLYQREFVPIRLVYDLPFWRRFIRDSLPFAIAVVFGMIHFRVDTVILQFYRGDSEVGLYNAAYNVVVGAAIVATAFMNALFPVMSRLYVSEVGRLRKIFWSGLGVMALLGLGVALVGTLFAGPLLFTLYGADYQAATLLMQLLAWGVGFSFLNNMTGNTLNAVNLQVTNMWVIGTGALANILLNLLLIPYQGSAGAAVATMTTELLVFLIGLARIVYFFQHHDRQVRK